MLALLALLCASAFISRGNTNEAHRYPPYPNPITGMSITQFADAMKEIKGMIPVGPKIISIEIQDDTHIEVTTGRITGPLAGGGTRISFEKIDGKWTKVKEFGWSS